KWCRRKPLLATLWGSVAALIVFVTVNGHYEAQTQAELARQADENRQVAEIQKTIAEQDRQLAMEARAQIRQRAITLSLDEGTRLLDRNQPTNALARFAAAFELQASGDNPLQTMINRVRLGSVIRLCPRPTAIWPLTTANVTFCDFTADGKIAVIGEFNGAIRLFNAETGKPIGEPLENDGYVTTIALSPDGDKAAACIVYEVGGTIPKSVIRVWDLKTQKKTRVRSMKHTGMAEVLGYHPDGKRLLTCEVRKAGDERDATLWDSESGKKLLEMKHSSDIRWAGFFPDGRRLATVNYTDNFRIWDCQTGKQTGRSLGHSNQSLRHAAISDDGSKITTVGYNTVRIWNAATLEPLTKQLDLKSSIKDVQFSHDGSLLLITTHKWDVRVWDTVTGNPRLSPLRHDSNVIQAKFSPDDRLIVTGSADGTARVWSTTSGQLEATLRHNKPVTHVAFHPDCRRILTGSMVQGLLATSGADARLWDLAITRVFAETELKHDDDVRALAMSSDGELIATGGLDHRVRVWSSLRGTAVTGWLDLGEPVADVSFHARNKVVFAHGTEKTAAAWKVPSGQLIGKTIQVADGLADAAMTPDGSVIATVSSSDKVQQWNSQTGASLAEATSLASSITLPSYKDQRRVLFSPSGDQLVGIHTRFPIFGMIRSWKTGSTTPGTLQVDGLRQGVNSLDSLPDALKLTAIPEAVIFSNDGKACLVVSHS
ncbi:MAG: WD40 repeat domain-containing protein, partial [Planctomycetaceae bacterium]